MGASLGLSEWLMLIPLICLCLLWCLMFRVSLCHLLSSLLFTLGNTGEKFLSFYLEQIGYLGLGCWKFGEHLFPNLIVDGYSKCSCQVFGIYCFKVRMVWSGKHIVHGPLFKHFFICQTCLGKCEISWVTKSSRYLKLH